MLNYQVYGLIEELPVAGGATFQAAWANATRIISSGVVGLLLVVFGGLIGA